MKNFNSLTNSLTALRRRCLRPDGDIHYLRHAPDPNAKPFVLLHCPIF
ncbi:MAG: hypothetical protein HYY24_20370 [Verrucomicrobia bacterium]|nr:hypothetical protein [Verrucomicrobiota bacterium]